MYKKLQTSCTVTNMLNSLIKILKIHNIKYDRIIPI